MLIFLRSLLSLRRGPVLGDDENAIRGSQHLKWVVREKRHRVFAKDSLVLSKTAPPKPSFHNVLTQQNEPSALNAPPVPGNACPFPRLPISPSGAPLGEVAAGWNRILSFAGPCKRQAFPRVQIPLRMVWRAGGVSARVPRL